MSVYDDAAIAIRHAGYREALSRINDTELPEAAAAAINRVAAMVNMQQYFNLRRRLILRNKYAEGSLVFYRANAMGSKGPRAWDRINAIVGSRQPFLGLQEEGGTERARGKSLAMPTVAGRGGDIRQAIPPQLSLRAMGKIGGTSQSGYMRQGKAVRGAFAKVRSKGFFILGPGPRLQQSAIFYRRPGGGGQPLQKIRLLGRDQQQVRAVHWHKDAVEREGTTRHLLDAFIDEGRVRLRKYETR